VSDRRTFGDWRRFAGADGHNEKVAKGGSAHRTVLRFRRRRPPIVEGKTAVVLSGGGNRGVSQVGMLRALVEAGVRPDVVIGTSVGSLNGAALARDPSPAGIDVLTDVWLGIDRELLFPDSTLTRAWRLASRKRYIWGNEGLAQVIDSFGVDEFSELAVPLRVIACDLANGEEAVIAAGPLKPALLASCALPGGYPPIEHDGRLLVDGGVINNVPVSHALSGPVSQIYVCDTSADLDIGLPRSAIEVMMRAFAIARQGRVRRDLERYEHDPRVIFLPRVVDKRRPFDFTGGEELMRTGYDSARDFLASTAHEAAATARG
jgi:NTE family protein